jgi:hypothetical protein
MSEMNVQNYKKMEKFILLRLWPVKGKVAVVKVELPSAKKYLSLHIR